MFVQYLRHSVITAAIMQTRDGSGNGLRHLNVNFITLLQPLMYFAIVEYYNHFPWTYPTQIALFIKTIANTSESCEINLSRLKRDFPRKFIGTGSTHLHCWCNKCALIKRFFWCSFPIAQYTVIMIKAVVNTPLGVINKISAGVRVKHKSRECDSREPFNIPLWMGYITVMSVGITSCFRGEDAPSKHPILGNCATVLFVCDSLWSKAINSNKNR